MVIRRAGLESLFPRGGRRGRTQTMPGWPTDINQFDFPGPALVAPPGIGLQQPTVVRAPAVGTQSEYMKPLPPGFKRFLQQPPPSPRIEEPGGPRLPRPPGVSLRALKMKRQQLREQLRQIEAQIRSLGRELPIRDPWDFGPEPPRPTLPWDPQPIGPPTMPGPGTPPPTIVRPPGTPIPQPPTAPTPWRPDPPWGG